MPVEAWVVVGVTAVWLAVEGRTIVTSALGVLPGGRERLDRLGWAFLATEAWTLALLGTAHGVLPGAAHEVYGHLPWAPAVFVAGWMARDLGLWFRRRPGAGPHWTTVLAVGAVGQVVGVLGLVAGVAVVRPDPVVGSGARLLAVVAPPVLVVGGWLHLWLLRLRRPGHQPQPAATTFTG